MSAVPDVVQSALGAAPPIGPIVPTPAPKSTSPQMGPIAPQPQPPVPTNGPIPPSPLDVSKYRVPAGDPSADPSGWDKRSDGTPKGQGFLGLLKRPDGKVSSEISVGVEIGGKEMEIPTIVPTLNQQELDWLLTHPVNDPKQIPPSIMKKAVQHAQMRMSHGLSPFAGLGESK